MDFLSRLMEVLSNMKISHAGLESNAVISMTCKFHTHFVEKCRPKLILYFCITFMTWLSQMDRMYMQEVTNNYYVVIWLCELICVYR